MSANRDPIHEIIERALVEDLGEGDVTTDSLVPVDWHGVACIVVKTEGVLAGVDLAVRVFQRVDPELHVDLMFQDGARVRPGDVVAELTGGIAGILKGERVGLNFLQRLSGIATETSRYVESVRGLPVRIMDTRKTTPGLRLLEKYAVRVGGGHNHRTSLSDGILIKDNHLAALRARGLTMKDIVARARQNASHKLTIEVEVTSVAEAMEAVAGGADIVMLDNMNLIDMRDAVKAVHGRALVEASGGITLHNVRAVAETGVDMMSIGALTHSVRALDISLKLRESIVKKA